MNSKTFKILKNTQISTRNGVASMGDTVNSLDVINPGCLPGMLKNKEIEVVKDGETKVSEAPKTTKKATKKADKKKDKE